MLFIKINGHNYGKRSPNLIVTFELVIYLKVKEYFPYIEIVL